jgi:hypothetical protein
MSERDYEKRLTRMVQAVGKLNEAAYKLDNAFPEGKTTHGIDLVLMDIGKQMDNVTEKIEKFAARIESALPEIGK